MVVQWKTAALLAALAAIALVGAAIAGAGEKAYVGSSACKECHAEIYDSFIKNSRKAHSFKSVQRMAGQLTDEEVKECYTCHTTGYGKPGGFVSSEKTPDLANLGCETCHGPGSAHVEAGGDSASIIGQGKISVRESCVRCHNEQRVEGFHYLPVIHAGAH
jgi:hypothetical protein